MHTRKMHIKMKGTFVFFMKHGKCQELSLIILM